jgi:hypothetical protein
MIRQRTMTMMIAALSVPAAFGMKYKQQLLISGPPEFTLQDGRVQTQPPPSSSCTSSSNTIAVGYEFHAQGVRILCADAGMIGFWTAAIAGAVIGQDALSFSRFLCPSGSALSGLQTIEGLAVPLPLCSTLVPNLQTGAVTRSGLYLVGEATAGTGSAACSGSQFIQLLRAQFSTQGTLQGLTFVCNNIETANLSNRVEYFPADLAPRTIGQKATLGSKSSETFTIDVFNLGIAPLLAADAAVELRFNTFAWRLVPLSNVSCSDIPQRKGFDVISLGRRCTLPGTQMAADGGRTSMIFRLEPNGPDTLRPTSATPASIISVKTVLTGPDAEDPVESNDRAAFPVLLQ